MTTLSYQDLQDDLYLVSINGDLDAAGGLAVRDELAIRATEHATRWIIDLSDVGYMSSFGLRVLLSVAKILQEGGGELHLAAPGERVLDVLTTSGYDTLFPVHETLSEARRYLGA